LAHDRANAWDIRKAAHEEGLRNLRDDGWLKALEGVTSVAEVIRVTKGDRLVD
jgi:general secretion pathway protein E/type IV pilus assembly protein PilB